MPYIAASFERISQSTGIDLLATARVQNLVALEALVTELRRHIASLPIGMTETFGETGSAPDPAMLVASTELIWNLNTLASAIDACIVMGRAETDPNT